MMPESRLAGRGALLALALLALAAGPVTVEILKSEAARPPGWGPGTQRGITRDPEIRIESPRLNGGAIDSPFHLTVTFKPHNHVAIDLDSVKVTYLKDPPVDLTTRVRPFTTVDGINVPEMEMPAGEHAIRIELNDTDGHHIAAVLRFEVKGAS
jgi:hypothetical protein